MKKSILATVFLLVITQMAQAKSSSVLLSEKTVDLSVDISTTKLKLSRADYSSPVVKVLVPELADVTILDHRNTNEGAPCMATYDTLVPNAVIQNNPAIEVIPMTIQLHKNLQPDPNKNLCIVSLSESIEANIRGFKFIHSRTISVGARHIDDCR